MDHILVYFLCLQYIGEISLKLFSPKKNYTDQNLFWILHYIFYLQELSKREVVNVTHLVIPAELGALLQAAAGTAFSHAEIQ